MQPGKTTSNPSSASDGSSGSIALIRGFWLKALGWVLLVWSVGLVSCQSLFVL